MNDTEKRIDKMLKKSEVILNAGKPKPMTNEEWIKSLDTEQLAEVFFEYRYINATPQQQLWLSANEDFVKGGIVDVVKTTTY